MKGNIEWRIKRQDDNIVVGRPTKLSGIKEHVNLIFGVKINWAMLCSPPSPRLLPAREGVALYAPHRPSKGDPSRVFQSAMDYQIKPEL